jgi:hypothetical protein
MIFPNFQIPEFPNLSSVYRLKPDFLEEMLVPFLFEENSGSVITGMCLKYPCTKNGTSALSLLGNFEILYPVVIEEIANNHFSLCFTVGI